MPFKMELYPLKSKNIKNYGCSFINERCMPIIWIVTNTLILLLSTKKASYKDVQLAMLVI